MSRMVHFFYEHFQPKGQTTPLKVVYEAHQLNLAERICSCIMRCVLLFDFII
jgi:hypothetical protein